MTTGDSIFYYAFKAVEWLNPVVYLIGLCVAVWAFRRCRKWGYLVVATYFVFALFSLLAMPSINRAIRAHRPPDYSAQTQQKIDAAVQEAVHKVLVEEGRPEGIPQRRTVGIPFGQILLVLGLWLVARRETHRPNTALEPTPTAP
jgi:hypothetical protein